MIISQALVGGLLQGLYYTVVALALALIYYPSRFFHFAHGATYLAAAYFTYSLAVSFELPLAMAVALALFLAGGLGYGMELTVFRSLRKRNASGLVSLVASLGIYTVLQNILALVYDERTLRLTSGDVIEGYRLFGASVTRVQLLGAILQLAGFLLAAGILASTGYGRLLRAVSADRRLAEALGLTVDGALALAFSGGSILMGLAAITKALDVGISPTLGLPALLSGAVAMLLAGSLRPISLVAGGLALGVAEEVTKVFFGAEWVTVVVYSALLATLLLRPSGSFVTGRVRDAQGL